MTGYLIFGVFVGLNEIYRRRLVKARERSLARMTVELAASGLAVVLVSRDLYRIPVSAHYEGADGAWAHVSFCGHDDVRVTGERPAR